MVRKHNKKKLNKISDKKYLINSAPINIRYSCKTYQINIEANWEKRYYSEIVNFKRQFDHQDYFIETSGSMIAIIPFIEKPKYVEFVSNLNSELSIYLGVDVFLKECNNNSNMIRNIIGGILNLKLETLGFEKIQSYGSVGRYFHHSYSDTEKLSSDLLMERVFEFSVDIKNNKNNNYKSFLSIDIKTIITGDETLSKLLSDRKLDVKDLDSWNDTQRSWRLNKEYFNKNWLINIIDDKKYYIDKIIEFDKLKSEKIGIPNLGKYRNYSLKEFIDCGKNKEKPKWIIIMKDKSTNTPNPNKTIFLTPRMLKHRISHISIKNKEYEKKFHYFSKPKMSERSNKISEIFKLLKSKNIISYQLKFKGEQPQIALPSVKENNILSYGRVIDLASYGVEEWGRLKEIVVYYQSEKIKDKVKLFLQILSDQMNTIARKSKNSNLKIISKVVQSSQLKNIANKTIEDPASILHMFILENIKHAYSYKQIKTWFTQENKKPVQAVKYSTIVPRRANNDHRIKEQMNKIIKTMIPQILAKTGGLPYSMHPKILDKTLIIGLDKGRDSSSTRPSASAGVAAVTTDGRYVSGASTPLDTTKNDSIDVDILAPPLLKELKDKYKDKLEYLVILRDGSPQICKPEVPQWEKYIEEYNMGFVFFASRKMNHYRIFPINNNKLKLPVILYGDPLQENEFLVISANSIQGTPKPVLYTMMQNTSNEDEIIQKVIPQVISMSMLSWESPMPTSQPLPLHYADKLAAFTQLVQQAWNSSIESPMFI